MSVQHTQKRRHCDHCGGRFGMVTHRWWGKKFCKRACKQAYFRQMTLDCDPIRRWFGLARAAYGMQAASLFVLPSR
jgi:hypothetical protein